MSLIADAPQRILIIRLSAIGDIIMTSALLPVLAEAYPEAKLSWLVEETSASLLQGHPRLDTLYIWPRRRWGALWRERRYLTLFREFRQLAGALRRAHFDLVLDLQGLLKSGLWAWLSGGKLRIGLGSAEGSQWLMSKVVDNYTETRRLGSEYLKLAEEMGLNTDGFAMDIRPDAAAQAQAEAKLAASGVSGRFVVFCPFTTRPQKHWFEDRWVQLAQRLAQEKGLQIVVLGGPSDRDSAERLAAAVPGLLNLAGQTTLPECAAIIDKASLLVGVDTGLTHLGTAMGTPTIALFGSTRPYLKPGTERTKVLYAALACSPCRRHPSCEGRFDCMQWHTPDTVFAEATMLMETYS
jgi:heptosyltransferase-1